LIKVKRYKRLTCFMITTFFLGISTILPCQDISSAKTTTYEKQIFMSQAEKTSAKSTVSAYLPERSYQFKPVAEGVKVTHDFVVQNKGTDVLKIDNVKTG
jgi:hypothetical protein